MLQAAPSPGVANASADCDAGSFRLGPFCFANVTALSLPGRAESTSFSMGANDLGSGTGDASAIAVGENAQTNTVTDVQLNDGVTTVSSSSVAISGWSMFWCVGASAPASVIQSSRLLVQVQRAWWLIYRNSWIPWASWMGVILLSKLKVPVQSVLWPFGEQLWDITDYLVGEMSYEDGIWVQFGEVDSQSLQ